MDDGLVISEDGFARCWWAAGGDELYRDYHDAEWGLPSADDVRLFEKICLEGFQSGLSWLTILRKREHFREAFAGFVPSAVARFDASHVERLMADAGIVRNRRKIEATINNAQRALELAVEHGSLAAFVWRFEPDESSRPARMTRAALLEMAQSPESVALSAELKRRGWAMVGPTTVYSFMQALGIVNDHLHGCAARDRVESARMSFMRPR